MFAELGFLGGSFFSILLLFAFFFFLRGSTPCFFVFTGLSTSAEGKAERALRSNGSQAGKGWVKPRWKTRKGKGSRNYLARGLLQRVLHSAFNLL